ncbi:MAG: hypothetical protein DCC75_01110 [Proteobacteria bacterium]|nr:MAG: hypothetical protein DCC75_01110 [Pseudomonadota bacterium]
MNEKVITRSVLLVVLALFSSASFAQESALHSTPIEADAHKLSLPSSRAFEVEPDAEPGAFSMRESLRELPAFFRDTTLNINLRNFYFARSDASDAPGNDSEKISWAQGGSAKLKSGKLFDIFSVGGELFFSENLYGPKDKDGALLLEPGQEGYTVIGVANPRFEYAGHLVSLYRQRHELPYVNSQENRMTPNTFESYSYGYLGEGGAPPFQFGVGYLDRIKKRNSDEFVHMSEAAGVSGAERGMPWIGARIRPTEDIKITAVNYAGIDFLNIFYGEAEYSLKLSDEWGLKSSVQASEQRSIGDNLLLGDDISVAMWGAQQAVSFRKFQVRTAVTVNDRGTSLRSPFGSYPGYNSSIVEDYNRAGELAWKIGIAYDFAAFGVDGLSAYADYIQGNHAVDDFKQGLNDKDETDVNIDYRIKEGWLSGFWLRLRGGFVHEATVGTTEDYRVILNYDFPVI